MEKMIHQAIHLLGRNLDLKTLKFNNFTNLTMYVVKKNINPKTKPGLALVKNTDTKNA